MPIVEFEPKYFVSEEHCLYVLGLREDGHRFSLCSTARTPHASESNNGLFMFKFKLSRHIVWSLVDIYPA